MFKDKAHFVEELTKSIQTAIDARKEELEKGLHLRGGAAGDATKQAKMKEVKEKGGMQAEHSRLTTLLINLPQGSEKYKGIRSTLDRHEAKMKAAGVDVE